MPASFSMKYTTINNRLIEIYSHECETRPENGTFPEKRHTNIPPNSRQDHKGPDFPDTKVRRWVGSAVPPG